MRRLDFLFGELFNDLNEMFNDFFYVKLFIIKL